MQLITTSVLELRRKVSFFPCSYVCLALQSLSMKPHLCITSRYALLYLLPVLQVLACLDKLCCGIGSIVPSTKFVKTGYVELCTFVVCYTIYGDHSVTFFHDDSVFAMYIYVDVTNIYVTYICTNPYFSPLKRITSCCEQCHFDECILQGQFDSMMIATQLTSTVQSFKKQ